MSTKEWRQANKEKRAEYYQANKEKIAECQRKYRQANKEKDAERQRKRINNLTDSYVKEKLCRKLGVKASDLNEIPNDDLEKLIEGQRKLIKLYRIFTGENNGC